MNVFIVIQSVRHYGYHDSYFSEDIRGVFLTLDQAVNNASGAIRIEEHSTVTNQRAAIYSTHGRLVVKNTV